jgi:hypothetical protein
MTTPAAPVLPLVFNAHLMGHAGMGSARLTGSHRPQAVRQITNRSDTRAPQGDHHRLRAGGCVSASDSASAGALPRALIPTCRRHRHHAAARKRARSAWADEASENRVNSPPHKAAIAADESRSMHFRKFRGPNELTPSLVPSRGNLHP